MTLSRRQIMSGGALTAAAAVAARFTGTATAWSPSPLGPTGKATVVVPTIHQGTRELRVIVGLTQPGSVALRYWPTGSPGMTVQSPWQPTVIQKDNLSSMTTVRVPIDTTVGWTYQPVYQTATGQAPATRSPWTVPGRPAAGVPSSFTINFGSCFGNGLGAGSNATNAWQSVSPNAAFFAVIGDFGYPDGSAASYDTKGFMNVLRTTLTDVNVVAVLARCPLHVTPDDHDYGEDGARSDPNPPYLGSSAPSTSKTHAIWPFRKYAAEAMAALTDFPYPAQSYRTLGHIGDAEFFQLDMRRYTTPDRHANDPILGYNSQIGPVQMSWLKAQMVASTARVLVVLAPMTPSWDQGFWGQSQIHPAEWKALWAFFGTLTKPVVILSGDHHASAAGRWHGASGNTIVELLAGPMNTATRHNLDEQFPGTLWSTATRTTKDTLSSQILGQLDLSPTTFTVSARRYAPGGPTTIYTATYPIP